MSSKYKKVFVTGGAGFIGKHFLQFYQNQGVAVCGIDLVAAPEFNVQSGDLMQTAQWQALLADCDLIIHCAALVSNTSSMDKAWEVNVKATEQLLKAAVSYKVKRFVQISSIAATGFDTDGDIDELVALKPIGHPYVDTKIASEHIALAYHASGQIDVTIVRPADVYGPGSQPWTVMPIKLMKEKAFLLPDYGRGSFEPVYIDDFIVGAILAAEKDEGIGQIFQITGDCHITTSEYFDNYARMLGLKSTPKMSLWLANLICQIGFYWHKIRGKHTEIGKNSMLMFARKGRHTQEKAKTLLGYQPKMTLEEGIKHCKDWLIEAKYL